MTEIEYPKCPRCSRDIEDYEPDEDTGTARPIREPDRPAPSRHFVTAWPCGHRVKIEGLAFVVRAALAPCPHIRSLATRVQPVICRGASSCGGDVMPAAASTTMTKP
jgi:hypothetical protein